MAMPMSNYSCRNWTMNRYDKRRAESAEMRFFRSVVGFTFLDQNRNTDILYN